MPSVLFLCTGNYYRSRFAEVFFNHHANRTGHKWRATSRGLELHPGNEGPISIYTLQALERLQIPVGELRFPSPAALADFEQADHVVAVKEAEHRRLMERNFPHWTDRIEYWQVHDLDCSLPQDTIRHLEQEVTELLQRLS